jgi:hypothetical protein
MVLDSSIHDTSIWPHLYETDLEFATTYQMLGEKLVVANFHLYDEMFFHLVHLFVPSRERGKIIWEAYYSRVVGHFGIEKILTIMKKHFY